MSISSLRQIHAASGAQFTEGDSLPRSYGDVRAEYAAIRRRVAVIDCSPEGKLEVSGKNSVQFINGLVTNEVKALAAGNGVPAAFLDTHGKVIALCRIYHPGPNLLVQLDATRREKIYKNLSRFLLAGEFFLTDVTEQKALISLQGSQSAALLESLTGQAISSEDGKISEATIADASVLMATHARCGEPGFDLFVAVESAPQLWQTLIECGQPFGARAAGQDALEIARIEAGVPREGVDVNETNILLEAGFENAVSYTKGCYLGQEIIARIHWRGQPAKRLLRLTVTAAEVPPPGADLYASDGKKVGVITSSTRRPEDDQIIALGYVHRYHLAHGTELAIKNGDAEIGQALVINPSATADPPPATSQPNPQ